MSICIFAPPLTADEVCEWAGISKSKLYRLARAGALGRIVGGRWYFGQEEVARVFLGGTQGNLKGEAPIDERATDPTRADA